MTTTSIVDHLGAQLRAVLAGRPVVVAADALVTADELVRHLGAHGVERLLVVAGTRGTGWVDPRLERRAVVLGTSGPGVMGGIRSFLRAMADPPDVLRAAVEEFDPDFEAIVVGPLFAEVQHLLGRPVLGARPWAWQALEDKTTVDPLWDRAGVRRASSRVVDARRTTLLAAADEVDRGDGTVWAADNRSGWHGGAALSFWVDGRDGVDQALGQLALAAERVRVMPFLEGLPCSIHGWVFDDHVATFHPVEIIVLRDRDARRFVYAGVATTWRPDARRVAEMRDAADRVGRLLRDEVGYRGVFTIDGVATADGFLPTELNPRYGAGMAVQARTTGVPAYLLHLASVSRPELDWRPRELEDLVRTAGAAHRVARGSVVVDRDLAPRTVEARRDGRGRWAVVGERRDEDGSAVEPGSATVSTGPSAAGGMVRVAMGVDDDGEAAAPALAALLDDLADELGHGLPRLESVRDAAAPDG